MDININVTLDSGTTKAIALLAESILAAATPATENEAPASAPDPEPAAKVTREEVRKAAGKWLEDGKNREDVKGWLEEFGAESITTLDEKHLPEMHEHLTA